MPTVGTLDERDAYARRAIELREKYGLTYEQIAERLGEVGPAAVRNRVKSFRRRNGAPYPPPSLRCAARSEEVHRLRLAGIEWGEIGRRYERSPTSVQKGYARWLKRQSVAPKIRPASALSAPAP